MRLENGQRQDMLALGGAAAAPLCGEALHEVRAAARSAERMAVHGSLGHTVHHGAFMRAMTMHSPWDADVAWWLSVHCEGATAVNAACEVLLARQPPERQAVAVASRSYHGPALGSGRMSGLRRQVIFPAPHRHTGEGAACFDGRLRGELAAFLRRAPSEVGVLLVEPQGGSSSLGARWPPSALRWFVSEAQSRGIAVCCDEVMCSLARHGEPSMFLSTAWRLNPDAVVFGKGVAGGLYPLSGALIRAAEHPVPRPREIHTFSGGACAGSVAAAAHVLRTLPRHYGAIRARERQCDLALRAIAARRPRLRVDGGGLLWGVSFNGAPLHEPLGAACIRHGVWPYFVRDGLLLTPPLDISHEQLGRGLRQLTSAFGDLG